MREDTKNEIERYLANARKLEDAHAYAPADEHDACGVGLISDLVHSSPSRHNRKAARAGANV